MAGLVNLGTPFGSPSRIINVPAPAGSALAGQIQMQAWQGLGRALGMYLGQRRADQLRQQDIRGMQGMEQQQDIFNTMYGARGLEAPQAQMPIMQSRMGQQAQLGGQLGRIFADPLESEYKRAQIKSTKALTKQREEAAKQELPNRMLRQADRYLRVVDDIMSEYWYTPEGAYRNKLLKDAQSAREKAVRLIEKYGAGSEAGKVSIQQLDKLDEEIKRAGGKVSKGTIAFGKPTTKEQFDKIYKSLRTPKEKQAFINAHWRPEFGRSLK